MEVWELNHPAWIGSWNDEQERTFQGLLRSMQNGTQTSQYEGLCA